MLPQGAMHHPQATADLYNAKLELQVKKGSENDSEMFQTAVTNLPARGEPDLSTGIKNVEPMQTGSVMEGDGLHHLFIQHLFPSFKKLK